MDLAEVRSMAEQALQQPEVASVVCRLGLVQPQLYIACQELKEGRSLPCNRRVDSGGFCAACNRAGKTAARFNLLCRFADYGDNAWLTTFHEAAQAVVGITAEKAQEIEQGP